MKRGALIVAIIFAGGLLVCSQALATGQSKQGSSLQGEAAQMTTQAGEQARQQMAIEAGDQSQQLSVAQAKELQRLLQEQGYEVGDIDGAMGSETMAAIRQFQDSEGLAVTGSPNPETLRALAPSTDQQEFFGLSPEFGEMEEAVTNPIETPAPTGY